MVTRSWGEGMVGSDCYWVRSFFPGDENVPKLDNGNSCFCEYTKDHKIIHFLKGKFYGV